MTTVWLHFRDGTQDVFNDITSYEEGSTWWRFDIGNELYLIVYKERLNYILIKKEKVLDK